MVFHGGFSLARERREAWPRHPWAKGPPEGRVPAQRRCSRPRGRREAWPCCRRRSPRVCGATTWAHRNSHCRRSDGLAPCRRRRQWFGNAAQPAPLTTAA
jgi:hypothetical protein